MDEVHLEYINTEEEYLRSVCAIIKINGSLKKWHWILIWVATIGASIGLVPIIITIVANWSFAGINKTNFIIYSVMALTGWTFIYHWKTKSILRKHFRKMATANKVIRWKITENCLETEADGARTTLEWRVLIKIHDIGTDFLLFVDEQAAHWIPKSAFKSIADCDLFQKWITQHQIKLMQ